MKKFRIVGYYDQDVAYLEFVKLSDNAVALHVADYHVIAEFRDGKMVVFKSKLDNLRIPLEIIGD